MKLKGFLHQVFRRLVDPFGLEIIYKGDFPGPKKRAWFQRLKQTRDLGFAPKTILDGGAFQGLWSRQAAQLFPGAQFILVEPNPYVQGRIAENIQGLEPHPIVLQAALGASNGAASFNIWGDIDNDQGASLLNHVVGPAGHRVEVQVDTLDHIAQKLSLLPDLIKLDLQGGELDALRGGDAVLQHAEFAIIEFGCLDAYLDRTSPRELLDLMYDHDYGLYDIVSLANRPYDGALTGGDFFFVKNSSILRDHKGWQ